LAEKRELMKKKNIVYLIIVLGLAVALFYILKGCCINTSPGDSTLDQLVSWVILHGYFLFFVAAFFEGPLVTTAAGVACALGYYSIEIIILLSIFGDLCPDAVFYSLGYFGGKPLLDKYGKYIGITRARIEKIKILLHRHLRKTIVAVKLAPLIPVPGIIVIGSLRASTRKFIETATAITIPKSIFFALLGYYSGKAYKQAGGLIANSEIIIFLLTIIVIAIFLMYQKVTFSISEKMESSN
jgi:membrane protein DedA with SNARE-associated domain